MILISEDVWSDDFVELQKRFPITHEPDLWNRKEDLKTKLANAEALVVRNRTQVTRELIEAAPKLKVIARAGVGLDNIDIQAADDNGVVVAAALGINAVAVAEHTLGLAISLARSIVDRDRSTRAGEWNRAAGTEISNKTWGLLGFGATGRAVAKLLQGFGCEVLAYDPFVQSAEGVKLTNLDEVITKSDVISIHLPATKETTGMINHSLITKMKKSTLLVNVGRGEVINETDLESALRDKLIAGAALDVRVDEPPKDNLFKDLSNVILTPHIAGITKESQAAINRVLVSEIEAALTGTPHKYAVGKVKQASR
jgi:D-3-phosphoglycerate dehydrogenase/(S)-sulfolactate dehydrogenase